MQLREHRGKFTLEDDRGRVVIITSDVRVCRFYAKELGNERNGPGQDGVPNQQAADGLVVDRPDGPGDDRDDRGPGADGGS